MNHMGLIDAIETTIGRKVPILNCPKCSSFWFVAILCSFHCLNPIAVLTTSFLASYASIWLELLMGIIDALYLKAYEKIYPTNDNDAVAANTD